MDAQKICRNCEESYPATPKYFTRQRRNKDGLKRICKKCWSEYKKALKRGEMRPQAKQKQYRPIQFAYTPERYFDCAYYDRCLDDAVENQCIIRCKGCEQYVKIEVQYGIEEPMRCLALIVSAFRHETVSVENAKNLIMGAGYEL